MNEQAIKIKVYFEFIDVVMDMIGMGTNKKSMPKVKALATKLQSIGLHLVVVATDDVVEKFIRWRGLAMLDGTAPEDVIEAFADVLHAMRKEIMGSLTVRRADDVMDILF